MQRLIWLLFIAAFAVNCGGDTATAATEETAETPTEETAAATEEASPETPYVLNPNIASVRELTGFLGISEEFAQQIIDGRPYLNMNDFSEQLGTVGLEEAAVTAFVGNCFVPLNLNTASEEEFKMVPGVGDKMAHEFEEYRPYKKIAQFRREMGKYVNDEEIARYEKYVFVPVALNSATDEEILAIPGVGKKMLREFKEYRPYVSIEQFRREIGKYVDDNELARLERYVYVDTAG
ncbi:MAG: helix-hairpin-helix domain-containing protein [Bacteroidota bacterium]